MRDDFPTEGNPLYEGSVRGVPSSQLRLWQIPGVGTDMKPTEAIPVLATSKPTPPPPPPPEVGVSSSRLSLASLALSWPRWYEVALFCSAMMEGQLGLPFMPRMMTYFLSFGPASRQGRMAGMDSQLCIVRELCEKQILKPDD